MASVQVSGVASIASASPDDLVFVEDEKYLSRALQSGAGAVIAGEFAAGSSGKPLLICRHPKLAFARAARLLRDGEVGRVIALECKRVRWCIPPFALERVWWWRSAP